MSRVKVHSKEKHHRAYKLNSAEQERARKGKKIAIGTVVVLVVIVAALFLYLQFEH